jgi:formylglycine-generating enzyme required for sulfatase activity
VADKNELKFKIEAMKSTDNHTLQCPNCGEPTKAGWKICPACEFRLSALTCPLCGQEVKENWKRCPECEARLLCGSCGRRLAPGSRDCKYCRSPISDDQKTASNLIDTVTGMELVRVPGGTYLMGDSFGDGLENEGPVHEVELHPFYIGRYPVTQTQWLRVMPANPSAFRGDNHPVEQVSWIDIMNFLPQHAAMAEGGPPYRLPTEAEWEYAARSGGREEKYAGGDQADSLAWYGDNSDGKTHPVGLKKPNGLGLHDMSGNVWEWCQDIFNENAYSGHAGKNPVVAGNGSDRVIRGGSFNLDEWSLRCTRRFGFPPDFCGPGLGFRLARDV